MLETSADLLKVIAAVSIGVLTFFLCWALFYAIMSLRNIFLATRDARRIFDKVEELISAIKDKVNSSASYLLLIGEAVRKIMEFMRENEGGFHFPGFLKKEKANEEEDGKKKKSEKSGGKK